MAGPLELIDDWPVPTAAAGVLAPDGTVTTWGPADLPFALASVTKPLAALAVLVAVEELTLDLDQTVAAPGVGGGVTVRHLLAHASGLAFDRRERIALPGRRRIYSNVGFEVLGEVLEQASGLTIGTYLHEAWCQPLGLAATQLAGSPAHAARSSVDDLLVVAEQLLRPTLLAASTVDAARSEQFAGIDGVLPGFGRQRPNPWGLGFEVRGHKQPHWTGQANSPATFGHFGRAGTFLWVDPDWGGALVVLTDRDFGPWAAERWPLLADAVLADHRGRPPTPAPSGA